MFFKVIFRLTFNKLCVVVDVLLDLKEFFYELFKWSAIYVSKLSNENGVKDSEISQTL